MKLAKHTLVISVAICVVQVYLMYSYFMGDGFGFAHFWTSCGFAYGFLGFGVVTSIASWHNIKNSKGN